MLIAWESSKPTIFYHHEHTIYWEKCSYSISFVVQIRWNYIRIGDFQWPSLAPQSDAAVGLIKKLALELTSKAYSSYQYNNWKIQGKLPLSNEGSIGKSIVSKHVSYGVFRSLSKKFEFKFFLTRKYISHNNTSVHSIILCGGSILHIYFHKTNIERKTQREAIGQTREYGGEAAGRASVSGCHA